MATRCQLLDLARTLHKRWVTGNSSLKGAQSAIVFACLKSILIYNYIVVKVAKRKSHPYCKSNPYCKFSRLHTRQTQPCMPCQSRQGRYWSILHWPLGSATCWARVEGAACWAWGMPLGKQGGGLCHLLSKGSSAICWARVGVPLVERGGCNFLSRGYHHLFSTGSSVTC